MVTIEIVTPTKKIVVLTNKIAEAYFTNRSSWFTNYFFSVDKGLKDVPKRLFISFYLHKRKLERMTEKLFSPFGDFSTKFNNFSIKYIKINKYY